MWCQLLASLLSDRMTSHLHSLGVASASIHRLIDRVTAMTSRLVRETRQLVLNISATPISADHVTEIYRTAETGRRIAQLAFNATRHAMWAIFVIYCLQRLITVCRLSL